MIEAALMCLALNVYFEARNDNMVGQYAVAQVVMNRVQSSKFPNDVCSVVKQSRNDGTCQFSWYCDGKSDKPREAYAWAYAQMVAADTLIGQGIDVTDITQGATHYHAHYVRPYWADKLEYTVTYGSHLFYK